jgi:predicted PolB exonuclease-like 3'-5' exonuclease
MINVPLDKILFIDIETVGIEADYPTLEKKNPKLAELFSNYESWFKKRFPEDIDVTLDQLFQTRTALVPEFARIVTELGYFLCGHNVKNFDIPMMAKRMIINNILPPKIFPTYDTKPWEIKAIDTRDVWQYGQYASISTLDLMCGVMGVESSKSDEMDGSRVHEVFYKEKNIDKINTYCEKDVKVLYEVVKKLQNLL